MLSQWLIAVDNTIFLEEKLSPNSRRAFKTCQEDTTK